MLAGIQGGEGGAEEWRAGEIEKGVLALAEEGACAGFPGAVVTGGKVADFQIDGAIGMDLLEIAVRGDDGAEGFVAPDEELKGVAQGGGIKRATECEGDGLVVNAGGGIAGIDEGPEAALGAGTGMDDGGEA